MALRNAGHDSVVVEPGIQGAQHAHQRGLNPVICSTIEDADFKSHSINAAGLFDVLEHLDNDKGFLLNIKQLLVPEGRLYIFSPTFNFLWSALDDKAGHVRRYTCKSLKRLLESTGFAIEFQTYTFCFLPLPIFLCRSLPSRLGMGKRFTQEKVQSQHHSGGGLTSRLINRIFKWETNRLKGNKRISFGASCLVVAKSS